MTLQRYLTRLIWLCITPLLLLAVWLAFDHVQEARARVAAETEDVLWRVQAAFDDALRERIMGLQLLIESPLADDEGQLVGFYAQALSFAKQYKTLIIKADPQTRAMLFTTRLPLGSALPPLPQVKGRSAVDLSLRSGQVEVSDAFRGPITGVLTVAVAVPARRASPAPFVLIGAIEAPWLEQRLVRAGLPEGWTITLRDSQGVEIARQGPPADEAEHAAVHLRRTLAVAPWTLELTVPRALYREQALDAGLAVGAGIVVLTLTGALGGGMAARRLANAIHGLTAGAGAEGQARPVPTIREVRNVQALLDDATARRDQAEAERRAVEQRHREVLERASVRLQLSEARLRAIVDSASEGIITIDRDQRILMVNGAAAHIFCYEPGQLLGRSIEILLPDRYRSQHGDQVRAFGATGSASRPMGHRRPVPGLRANGGEFLLEATISCVHVDGQQLFTVILRDITERLRAEAELRRMHDALAASHAELQRLIDMQEKVQHEERTRIARELHDDLQQGLAAIKMEASGLRQSLPGGDTRAVPGLANIDRICEQAIVSTRRIVQNLRPQMLEDLGLVPALEWLASQFSQRSGIACTVEAAALGPDDEARLAPVGVCLYRVVQESLNNVAKHAAASTVRIVLADGEAGRLRLSISDDGVGIAPGRLGAAGAFGLLGMRERVRAAGGVLRISGAPGQGTTVEVEVPMPVAQDLS